MCYSVMVETDLKRMERDFDAAVDVAGLQQLLVQRQQGVKNLKIPRGIEPYFKDPKTPEERAVRELLDHFTDQEVRRFEAKVLLQKSKIEGLERALALKHTKTNQEKLETAQRVLSKAAYDVERLKGPVIPTDGLIHQYTYAPLLVRDEDGKRRIRFLRYQVRPRWADKEPNRELNLFNARLDKLEDRRTWAPLFMERHAALVFKGFYEWVEHPETKKSAVINFLPKDGGRLWVPALHDTWTSPDGTERIDSFAIVTTDPPDEVSRMGHDRCPLVSRWEFLPDWLNPKSATKAYVQSVLKEPRPVEFTFQWGVTNDGGSEAS